MPTLIPKKLENGLFFVITDTQANIVQALSFTFKSESYVMKRLQESQKSPSSTQVSVEPTVVMHRKTKTKIDKKDRLELDPVYPRALSLYLFLKH